MKIEPRRRYDVEPGATERVLRAALRSDPDARECLIPFHETGSVDAFVRCYEQRKATRAARRP